MRTYITAIMVIVLSAMFSVNAYSQRANITWSNLDRITPGTVTERSSIPLMYRALSSDFDQIKTALSQAPFELSDASKTSPMIIELPMPYGESSLFYVTEYSMMEVDLAKQFPETKTFNIKGVDDLYATGKISVTELGFHAMVLTINGDYFIEPYNLTDKNLYISFYKSDFKSNNLFECFPDEQNILQDNGNDPDLIMSTGEQLRTYRLACAATGEYTAFFGGTVILGQAAIVVAINRVNGVYEKDLSVRMTLIANNNTLVFTNSGTDPYTNSNGVTMLTQNQNYITTNIGSANYDIGHVFSTGGGGVAGLGVVCNSANKARGVTGLPSPVGDIFYIDFVAHEMGHQFSGNHSFNGVIGNCSGGNRNAATAWEPGSGSTIMSYAGICGADDLQANSNDYFHTGNVSEMTTFTQSGGGNACPVTTATGNTPPVVTVPAGGFTIPISTPFSLTGSATDAESPGSLTYCWEQYDTGPAGSPGSPTGNAPIFRSFTPVTSTSRTFPKLSNLLNNTSTIGEILPTYTRSLRFRLTARDNNAGGGGIAFNTVLFNVSSTAGPFLVSVPNTNVNWSSAVPQTVTWSVANTTAAPVSCANVNILLSLDGGNTFPTVLLANTPNDGSQAVTLPNVTTTAARIKIEAVGNIFFDLSNVNFRIFTPAAVSSTFTLAQQGFYNTSISALNMRDTVRIYLRNTVAPYTIVDSGKTVIDSLTLSGSLTFSNAQSGTYYIVVKHRNALETWSKSGGEAFVRGTTFTYDFTSANTQAYGGNEIIKGGESCMFSGDVDQDYTIDATDLILISNDAILFSEGYVVTDVTGEGFVDVLDLITAYNNSVNFVTREAPPGAAPFSGNVRSY